MISRGSIEVRITDHVAAVRINRPERRNALNSNAVASLLEIFDEINRRSEIWVMTITGAGDKAFCAGADLKEFDLLARNGQEIPQPMHGTQRNLYEAAASIYKPTIAVLNGSAVAGGLELAMACDIRISVEDALFGMPEAKRGLGANFATVMLPRLIPRAIAFEMLYTGEYIGAPKAKQVGLVNMVVPKEKLESAARKLVDRIVSNAPLSLQRYKQMIVKGDGLSVFSALRLEAGPNPYSSKDREEGVRAFLEKRQPRWIGK